MKLLKNYIFVKYRNKTLMVLFLTFISLIFNAAQPFVFKEMINRLILHNNKILLIKILLFYIILNYLITFLENVKELYLSKYSIYASFNILLDVYGKILKYPYDKICKMSQGEIFKLLQDTNKFQQLIVKGLVKGFTIFVNLLIGVIILYKLYHFYVIIIILSLPLYYFIVKRQFRNIYNLSILKEKAEKAWLKEALPPLRQLKGIKKARIYNLILKKMELVVKNIEKISLSHNYATLKHRYIFHYSKISLSSIILVTCSSFIFNKKLTLGDYMAINMVFNTIFNNFNNLSDLIINDIINNIPHYKNLKNFLNMEISTPQNDITKLTKIRINNIFFRHLESNFVLTSKLIELDEKGIYYLIGKNGAGKSTFFDIIANLLKPEKGNIEFNNMDINSISEEWKKRNIFFLMQDPLILSGSIFANIILDTKISKNELRERAIFYDLYPFYEILEKRLDENLENENVLSGGEKQIIQILRLIVRDYPIILVDEGDSNLDFNLKKIFRKAILHMSKNKLILVITHDFSQLPNNDNIIIIKDNQILLKKINLKDIKKYLGVQK